MKIFSVVDKDTDAEQLNPLPDQSLAWDVYHIENYLLEPRFILKIMKDLGVTLYSTEELVYDALRDCARETLAGLVRHQLATAVRVDLLKAIKTVADPKSANVAEALSKTIQDSAVSVTTLVQGRFSIGKLEEMETDLRRDYESALAADTWRKRFRGRDILHRFVGRIHKTNYEVFRDLIIAGMRDSSLQPEGMRAVIEGILSA